MEFHLTVMRLQSHHTVRPEAVSLNGMAAGMCASTYPLGNITFVAA